MTKKDYILTILSRLGGYRPLALPLRDLVEHMELDQKFIDGLSAILLHAVEETHDEIQRDKLLQSQELIKKIQKKDDLNVVQLDQDLANMLEKL